MQNFIEVCSNLMYADAASSETTGHWIKVSEWAPQCRILLLFLLKIDQILTKVYFFSENHQGRFRELFLHYRPLTWL